MFRARWLIAFAAIICPLVAFGDAKPTQQILKVTPEGNWSLVRQLVVTVCVPETYAYTVKIPKASTVTETVDGQERTKNVTVYSQEERSGTWMKTVSEVKVISVAVVPETLQAFETDGTVIAPAELARRCASGRLVVVSPTTEMIAGNYASVFKPGTIIVALAQIQPPDFAPAGQIPAPRVPTAPTGAPTSAVAPPPAAPVPSVPVPSVPVPSVPVPSVPVPSVPVSGAPIQALPSAPAIRDAAPVTAGPGGPSPETGGEIPVKPAPDLVFISREGATGLKIRQLEETPMIAEVSSFSSDSSVATQNVLRIPQIHRHSITTTLNWNAVRISYPSQTVVAADRIKEKLGQGEVTAVLSSDGRLIDEFWLQNIKESVLVIRGVKLMSGGLPTMPIPGPVIPSSLPQAVPSPMPIPKPAASENPAEFGIRS